MLANAVKKIGALMPKLFVLLFVLGLSCAAFAQTNRASWANLSALQPGQKI
jgi:hypothetical protein